MMEMHDYFEELRQAIEPDPRRKREAQKADDPVREHLATHWSYASRHLATFLYGSYRRNTAVGEIKDCDVVVITNHTRSDRPAAVLEELKTSLGYLYSDPDLADQRRSIRIDRPLPELPDSSLTLDIVPAIYGDGVDGFLWIPDREKLAWVKSHPKGHMQYTSNLNARSYQGHSFVRLAKMMKWWWTYQFGRRRPGVAGHERKPKGFWIEVMAGQYADLTKTTYPELIISLLENGLRGFRGFRNDRRVPTLQDPGLPDRKIATSMTEQDFAFVLDVMEESLTWARAAWNAPNEERAREYWRRLFGDEQALAKAGGAGGALLSPAATVGGLRFPDRPVVPRKPGGFA